MASFALVTGAASGIGLALTKELVRRTTFVVMADINSEQIEIEAKNFSQMVETAVLDVCDPEAFTQLVTSVFSSHGQLDYIFNNAGVASGGPLQTLTRKEFQRIIDVDLMGVIHGVEAAYPRMIAQGFGHIVNTASLAGLTPAPFLAAYAAAKHGVVGLSLTLRVEAKSHGVRVTAVCPGPIDTPMVDDRAKVLLSAMGPLYQADLLAKDIMAGVDANDPLVIAPERARSVWEAFRATPFQVIEAMERHLSSGP